MYWPRPNVTQLSLLHRAILAWTHGPARGVNYSRVVVSVEKSECPASPGVVFHCRQAQRQGQLSTHLTDGLFLWERGGEKGETGRERGTERRYFDWLAS